MTLLQALRRTCDLLGRSGESDWSPCSPGEVRAEILAVIEALESGSPYDESGLRALFLPTGPVQEISIANGWGDAMIHLASVVDGAPRTHRRVARVSRLLVVLLVLGLLAAGGLLLREQAEPDVPGATPGAGAEMSEGERADRVRLGGRGAEGTPGAGVVLEDITLVPGLDVVLRGVVLRAGRPAGGAAVEALPAGPRSPAFFQMHGSAYPSHDGVPAAGARRLALASTDAAGRFELTVERRSRLFLRARADGAGTRTFFVCPPAQGDVHDLVLALPTGFELKGRVVGPDHRPAASVRIAALPLAGRGRDPDPLGSTQADAGGRFSLRGLPPGQVVLRVTDADRVVANQTVSVPHGAPVLVRLDTEAKERESEPVGGLQVVGRLDAGAEGVIVGGAVVALLRREPVTETLPAAWTQVALTAAAADGTFTFSGVSPGAFALVARSIHGPAAVAHHPRGWASQSRTLTLDASSSAEPLALVLGPCGRVEGRVLGATAGERQTMRIRLTVGDWVGGTFLEPTGTFTFFDVPCGHDAQAIAWGPFPREVRSEPFTVEPQGRHEVVLRVETSTGPRVRGVVRDPAGEPVAGAFVRIQIPRSWRWGGLSRNHLGPPWWGSPTGADGHFDLPWPETIDTGEVLLSFTSLLVNHPDYAPWIEFDLKKPTDEVPLEFEVVLEEGTPLLGLVLRPDGEPADGAQVRLNYGGGLVSAWTDEAGCFRFEHVWVGGSVYLEALHETGRHPVNEQQPAEYPRSDDEIVIRLEDRRAIAGVVVDEDGRPIANAALDIGLHSERGDLNRKDEERDATIDALPAQVRERKRWRVRDIWRRDPSRKQAKTDERGRFRVEGLAPGEHDIVVVPTPWTECGLLHTEVRGIQAGRSDVRIVVDSGLRIRGRVLGAEGKGVEGAYVCAAWPEPEGWGYGMPHDRYRPLTQTEADGSFALGGLYEGKVDVVVLAPDHLPTLREGVPAGGSVTVRLDAGERIEGRVLREEGRPFANLRLELVPMDPDQKAFLERIEQTGGSAFFHAEMHAMDLEVRTDGEGRFAVAGLLPGRWRVRQERSMVGPDDPLFPQTVVVAGRASFDIHTETALTVTGRVVDLEGKPATHHTMMGDRFSLKVTATQDGKKRSWDLVDEKGAFAVGGLRAGPVTLEVGRCYDWVGNAVHVQAGAHDVEVRVRATTEEERKARDPWR